MKHVVIQSISSIILYVLMAFLFSSFLSDMSKTVIESDRFLVEFNLLPLLLLVVLASFGQSIRLTPDRINS